MALKFAVLASLALLSFATCAYSQSPTGAASEILDDVRIPDTDSQGNEINQVSGLAWDNDEGLVYAVSDFGHIIHLKIGLADNKLKTVDPIYFGPLRDVVGEEIFTDAEDIVVLNGANGIKGDSQIAVVFEDGPAAALFTPQGEFVAQIDLPKPLDDRTSYQGANQRLESIAADTNHGFLLAPQVPLRGQEESVHTVYAADGKTWTFDALQPSKTSTKSMQLQPDGTLVLLEGFDRGGLLSVIGGGTHELRLRRLDIANCVASAKCPVVDYIPTDPTLMADRYEGLTRFGDHLFLLATDENSGSRLVLLRTSP